MYEWQNDGHQKHQFNQNDPVKCPADCGQQETHMHYLVCQDPRMKALRKNKMRSLHLQLKQKNTHPLIITTTMPMITKGAEETMKILEHDTDTTINMLKEAIGENHHLHQNLFEKGFHSLKWDKVQ